MRESTAWLAWPAAAAAAAAACRCESLCQGLRPHPLPLNVITPYSSAGLVTQRLSPNFGKKAGQVAAGWVCISRGLYFRIWSRGCLTETQDKKRSVRIDPDANSDA